MIHNATNMKKTLIALILALLGVFSFASKVMADDAVIDSVAFDKGPPMKLSFEVKNAFTKEIEEAIKSGVATSFTYIIDLNRVNSVWFNEGVVSWEFRHTVKYDTLKEEYEIVRGEAGSENSIRTKDSAEMKTIMATGDSIELKPPVDLKPGAQYEIRIMAELHTVELPFLLDYVLFFVKLWNVETDWYTFNFTP